MTTNTESATDDGLEVVGYCIRASDQFCWADAGRGRPFASTWREVVYKSDADTLFAASRAEVERLRAALGEIAWSNDSKWQSDRADKALNGAALSNKTTKG